MIVVVGATGQVGFAVTRGLRERGEEVIALVRPSTKADSVSATGARVVRGDLRDPGSLRSICEGADCVVATANTIVPRRGERADFEAIASGYRELGRGARAAGVRRFLFISVPRALIGHGAQDFDAKGSIETALRTDGPPLTVVRSSLFMEVWLPWLGSRLPLRGTKQATLERGYWFTRLAGAVFQSSLDRFGIALLLGSGNARHSFIAAGDVAESLVSAATAGDALGDELRLGGPEALSWREAAEVYGRVLGTRVRILHQPTTPFRTLSFLARRASPAVSQLLASQWLVAEKDSACPPDDARRLLGRDPISVETFLRQRLAA